MDKDSYLISKYELFPNLEISPNFIKKTQLATCYSCVFVFLQLFLLKNGNWGIR